MQAINTYLAVANVRASMTFLERALGFQPGVVLLDPDGQPRYAEMLPAIVPTARRLCAGRPDLRVTSELLATHVKGGGACAP